MSLKIDYICRCVKKTYMKNKNIVVSILLNVLFCAVTLWFYARNSFLRPYAGSPLKEVFAGGLLLVSLYANYFFFYPELYQKQGHVKYWSTLAFTALATALMDLAIAYKSIVVCNAYVIKEVGFSSFFTTHLLLVFGKNLALNFFPFLFRERQHFQKEFAKEERIVYQEVRKLDVVDEQSNVHLVPIEDIFYCLQQRNFTVFFTVQNTRYTRLGSMRHLEQLIGEEEFVRITTTVLVPYRSIESCKGDRVVLKKMPWEEAPTTFRLEPKTQVQVSEKITAFLQESRPKPSDNDIPQKHARPKTKRKPTTPPQEKIHEILACIEKQPNCNTADIVAATGFSLSTVERCISELKKQGLIEHTGSKKLGGYFAVES